MSSSRPDDLRQALRTVQRYLRSGTRSTDELRRALEQRELPRPVIQAVLAACSQRGWIDDEACARLCAVHWADQGYAEAAIRRRLLAKGLEASLVSRVLSRLDLTGQDEPRARALASRRRSGSGGSPRADQRTGTVARRLAGLLARRGFDPELIDRLLDRPPD